MISATIKDIVIWLILLAFWFFAGVMCSPFWLLITLLGAAIGEWKWKEAPRIFVGLVMIRWLFED